MRRPFVGVLVTSVLLAGCTREYDDDMATTTSPPLVVETATPDDASATTAPADDEAATAPAPEPSEAVDLAEQLTDDDLRAQVEWVLGLLEPGAEGPTATDIAKRLAPSFLDQVTQVEFARVLTQLRERGPYTVTGADQSQGVGRIASLALASSQQPVVLTIGLDEEGRVQTLLFQPDTSGTLPTLSAWADLDQALTELEGQAQVVVGEVDVPGGSCELVHTTEGLEPGGEPAPSGSVYKLLVLSAVVDAVAEGELTWDRRLTITPEVKSLPSGVLQDREDGSEVTVLEAARLMISISDNTATDLLVTAVGQPTLRAAATEAGVDATRIMPVATTRQFFQLGWQVDAEVRRRWAEAAVPETREAILADLPEELDLDLATITEPRWEADIDFSLTGAEVCGLHARLQQQARTEPGSPVRDILSANPGIGPVAGVSYQAFKGGSAPGALAFSFYVESAADSDSSPDTGRVLVVQVRRADEIDEMRASTITEAGLQLLMDPDD